MFNIDPSNQYKKLYAMLLDAIPSSVLMIDRDMRIVSVNRNFLEKSQRSIENTVGQRLERVFPEVILDNMDLMNRIRQVFIRNQPIRGQRFTYRAPGVPIRIYYYGILPFYWEGDIEGVMILMEDVTDQLRLSDEVRRVERHLASLVESATDLILSADVAGRIMSWNKAAERLSGYSFAEVQGCPFLDFWDRESRKKFKDILSKFKYGKESHIGESTLVTKEGRQVPVSWVISPMRDESNQVMGVVAIGRDLTEHRRLEMQLLQSQKLAALGVMAGGIAHEIRNPLTICSSAAQFLMEEKVPTDFRKECAEKIYRGIERTSVIIENLLKFARPSVNAKMEKIDIMDVIREAMKLVSHQASIQKVKIRTAFSAESLWISGIASLLQQVFMNLFLNAIKAMPDSGILNVAVENTEHEVRVRLSDTGHGISKADIDKIFDPFYTTSPVGSGTGLGLSLCYSIVKQHMGSIEVESEAGKGSVFTVRLPMK